MRTDKRAIEILRDYIAHSFPKQFPLVDLPDYDVYIVWKCKVLQNAKYLLCTNLPDMMYYELTYNGDKKEWYLDAYSKIENVVYGDR